MNILIIAGHGDKDPGAISENLREADLTRSLATKLFNQLKTFSNVKLFDTTKNMYRYLKNGGVFDFSPYDYILELHFNAGAKKTSDYATTGTEILVHRDESGISVEEKILSEIAALGFRNRGVKRRCNLYNMNRIKALGKSYALLEVCFIDDPDDLAKYNEDKTAKAIADGIKKGFGIINPPHTIDSNIEYLSSLGIITNKALWDKKIKDDSNIYYLIKKVSDYIKTGKV